MYSMIWKTVRGNREPDPGSEEELFAPMGELNGIPIQNRVLKQTNDFPSFLNKILEKEVYMKLGAPECIGKLKRIH